MIKKFILAGFLSILVLFFSCDKDRRCVSIPSYQSGVCIDSTLINDSIFCIEIYMTLFVAVMALLMVILVKQINLVLSHMLRVNVVIK